MHVNPPPPETGVGLGSVYSTTTHPNEPEARPCCPVCSAPVMDLRGQARCSRCSFTFCIGCEGGAGEAFDE